MQFFTSVVLTFAASVSAVPGKDLVPPDRQAQYSRVVGDVFLVNACAKRFGFGDVSDKAVAVLVSFAREFKFPDAENLVRGFAMDVKENSDGHATVASPALCADLADRLGKPR